MVYITLQKAATLCPYSQEYLSLRARQGKLKGVKIGRNWTTTQEWIQEYIEKSEEYKRLVETKRLNAEVQAQKSGRDIDVKPPANLPIYAPDAEMWEDEVLEEVARQKAFQKSFQRALALVSVVALFCIGVLQGRDEVFFVAEKVSPVAIESGFMLHDAMRENGFVMGQGVQTYFVAGANAIAKEYVAWLESQLRGLAKIFIPRPSSPKGLVVIPSSNENEKVKDQIRGSFSDEVRITPHDEETGITTPVFRKRTGEDYLYILVPLKDGNF